MADFVSGPETLSLMLDDLQTLPPVSLETGYTVRTLEAAGEENYLQVMRVSLEENADHAWFAENFLLHPAYDPHNQLIIYKDKEPVAAATAWQTRCRGAAVGLLHMVGVVREQQGRGLGRRLVLLALHRLQKRGFSAAMVSTQDDRLPALQLYLSLGFRPLCLHRSHKRRWQAVRSRLGNWEANS
ncbi:GNAT family N-acetyltransferase [Thermodesulfobacteriota bacterium]